MDASPIPVAVADSPPPAHKLFAPTAVGLATFLGSPLGGAAILALNYRRMGQPGQAWKTLFAGAVGTGFLLGAAWFVPDSIPRSFFLPMSIGLCVGMAHMTKSLQGPALATHQMRGGRKASLWGAAGIGLLACVLVLAVLVGVVVLTTPGDAPDMAHRLAVSDKEEIYYGGQITETMAREVGQELKAVGWFRGDQAASALLWADGTQRRLSIVVGRSAKIDDPSLRAIYEELARQVAPRMGGLPITVRLVSSELDELKSFEVK